MRCSECTEEIPTGSLFCNFCGERQRQTVSHYNWNTPYGMWKVTTEGDCEGRSTKDLGIHEGFIDEIAFALANQAGYSLRFSPAKINKEIAKSPKAKSVSVSLDIDSKTWDMTPEKRVEFVKKLFKDRLVNVDIEVGTYYASVTLKRRE